jgi:hypothetical protein
MVVANGEFELRTGTSSDKGAVVLWSVARPTDHENEGAELEFLCLANRLVGIRPERATEDFISSMLWCVCQLGMRPRRLCSRLGCGSHQPADNNTDPVAVAAAPGFSRMPMWMPHRMSTPRVAPGKTHTSLAVVAMAGSRLAQHSVWGMGHRRLPAWHAHMARATGSMPVP